MIIIIVLAGSFKNLTEQFGYFLSLKELLHVLLSKEELRKFMKI